MEDIPNEISTHLSSERLSINDITASTPSSENGASTYKEYESNRRRKRKKKNIRKVKKVMFAIPATAVQMATAPLFPNFASNDC